MTVEWNEPSPGFYISELAKNTIMYHNAVSGKQNFSKLPQGDCIVPVYFTHPPARPHDTALMDANRACYFMRRFKHEEKMLGPNEQAALDYVIAMLEQPL